jgi:hypothetical protein
MEQMMAHLLAKIRTNGEEMKEEMWAWWKEMKVHWEAVVEACPGKTEATDLEENPEETWVQVRVSGSP